MSRKMVFTAAMAGGQLRRSFLIKQRFFFAVWLLLALFSPWFAAWLPPEFKGIGRWTGLAVAGLTLVLATWRYALGAKRGVLAITSLHLFAVGFVLALMAPTESKTLLLTFFLNPVVWLSSVTFGYALNTVLARQTLSLRWEYLLTGPWFVLGGWLVYALAPSGDWIFLFSGVLSLTVLVCMQRGSRETEQFYQPSEWMLAAADLVPATCAVVVRNLAGRE